MSHVGAAAPGAGLVAADPGSSGQNSHPEEPQGPSLLLLPFMFLAVYMLSSCLTCVIYVKTNKSGCAVDLRASTRAFRALGRLDGKDPSQWS